MTFVQSLRNVHVQARRGAGSRPVGDLRKVCYRAMGMTR